MRVRSWERASRLGTVLAVVVIVIICESWTYSTPKQFDSAEHFDSAEQRIWSNDKVPTVLDDPDDRSVEVGTAFTTASDGVISAVRFYQGPDSAGADNASLWTSDGTNIATTTIPKGPSGWREIRFDTPVPVTADRTYVVSYRASRDRKSTRLNSSH